MDFEVVTGQNECTGSEGSGNLLYLTRESVRICKHAK